MNESASCEEKEVIGMNRVRPRFTPDARVLRLRSGQAAELICFNSSRCACSHWLRVIRRSGDLRRKYAGPLLLPDAAAQFSNTAQNTSCGTGCRARKQHKAFSLLSDKKENLCFNDFSYFTATPTTMAMHTTCQKDHKLPKTP